MMLPLCKFCGERHPLLKCPEFDAVEQAHVLIKEAKTQVAIGMAQVEGSIVLPDRPVGDIDSGSRAAPPVAQVTNDVIERADVLPAKAFDNHPQLAVPVAARTVVVHGVPPREHGVAVAERRKPHRYTKQDSSERSLEPWRALGISRRTYYRRKRNRE